MAKKNKQTTPAVEAPIVENAAEEVKNEDINAQRKNLPGMPDSMSQHDKVLYASVLQHRKDEMVRTGGENAEKYEAYTMIEDAMIIDVALTEAFVKRNPGGLIMCTTEKNWNMIMALGKEMGVSLPEFKSLPKPTKEQLAAFGMLPAPNQVMLKIDAKNVSKETKEKIKKEAQVVEAAESGKKEYLKDLTKIETDDQLKEALGFQLINPAITNPVDRLITTAQFYRSYLEYRAEKGDNAEAELAKIHEFTLANLLQDISTMVPPTFITSGFGKILCASAETSNCVVSAFNMFKRTCTDRKTKKCRYADEEIAAFVRVLINWWASYQIAEMSKSIAVHNENIKVLNKDAKKNAKGIESENKKIEGCNGAITHYREMINLTTDPSFDIADNFIDAYNHSDKANHKYAKKLAESVIETYYKGVDVSELEIDTMLLNIQQHIGITLNLFTSPLVKRDDYDENNLISFDAKKEPAEEEEKNA